MSFHTTDGLLSESATHAILELLPHHPSEPSISVSNDIVGIALPENIQPAQIMSSAAAIRLGVQLIVAGETLETIQDLAREGWKQ